MVRPADKVPTQANVTDLSEVPSFGVRESLILPLASGSV